IAIILFTATLTYAGVYQHEPLYVVQHAPAVSSAGAYGSGYSGYGHLNSGYGAHGYGAVRDKAAHGAYAHGDAAVDADSAHRDLKAHGAVGAAHSNFKDKGFYARNRGFGYEKAFAYDKQLAAHDIGAKSGAYGQKFGLSDNYGHSNLDAHNKYAHGAQGGHDRYGAAGYGSYGHLNTGYGGAGYAHGAKSYSHQPAAAYVVAHPAPAHSYSSPYTKITYH
ncbi:shematrin-like protein 1, partial [Limulus polyphemus]|uniref:Shematrin-like protein 1 n=1 Tax=Limulus polyphemus TaxID=6850 RepID=A0ABM1C397_LIMPO